jgi:hypothetical protein
LTKNIDTRSNQNCQKAKEEQRVLDNFNITHNGNQQFDPQIFGTIILGSSCTQHGVKNIAI